MDENKINSQLDETSEEIKEEQAAEPVAEETAEADTNGEEATAEEATAQEESEEDSKEESEEESGEEKPEKGKTKKAPKVKKLRNQALLRRGSFSVAITAAVLAGIIVLNILVGALSKRFLLEIDMTPEQKHSISAENVEYLKKLDSEVTVTLCADEDNYVTYMSYYYGSSATSDISEYLEQTLTLLKKYGAYNEKITVRYIDPQGAEFNELSQKYPSDQLGYGSIVVSALQGSTERHKVLGFTDIYQTEEDSTYAAYGISSYSVTGNNLETAVTSAIAYVTGGKAKKVAFLTGHSAEDKTEAYQELLKTNNYEITLLSDSILRSIPDSYDAVVIAAPTVDFAETELSALSDFLDNQGGLNKSLIYFADAAAPYLPNFSEFLTQWNIAVGEGILFETDDGYHLPEDPTTMLMMLSEGHEDLGGSAQACVVGGSVPVLPGTDAGESIKTEILVETSDTVVAAPVGVSETWDGAGNYAAQSYAGILKAEKSDYDENNEEIKSQIIVFAGTDFLNSPYNSYPNVANQNVVLACSELAVGSEDTGISFISKTITSDSFTAPTEGNAQMVQHIFMGLIPLIMIVAGIVVYVRRRNAQ